MTGPMRRAALLADGASSRHALDFAVKTRRISNPFRGVYLDPGQTSPSSLWSAALLTQANTGVLSHRSAAVALGLRWIPSGWSDPGQPVDITVPTTNSKRERPGIRLRRLPLSPDSIRLSQGVPVTSPARTAIDLIRAGDVGRLVGLQLLDGLLRFGQATRTEIELEMERLAGTRGSRRARALVGLMREGVDSPQETWLRLALLDGGIPDAEIDIGMTILGDDGRILCRADLGSRRLMMWWEYDGRAEHSTSSAFGGDRIRDRFVQERGWLVSRFSSADHHSPERLPQIWRAQRRSAAGRIAAFGGLQLNPPPR